MAMDADDSDVPEGSQHDFLMEALERDLEARTAVHSVESDTESVLSSEREGWSDHEECTEVPATVLRIVRFMRKFTSTRLVGRQRDSAIRIVRGWKLFMALPKCCCTDQDVEVSFPRVN